MNELLEALRATSSDGDTSDTDDTEEEVSLSDLLVEFAQGVKDDLPAEDLAEILETAILRADD
jgi:hypothetical protein